MRERDGRKLGCVQNLVGIGVADAADHARVGESALESAILGAESSTKGVEIAVEDFDATGVDGMEAVFAGENMERSAAFGAAFGEHQRAAQEVKGGESIAAGKPGIWRTPMQTTGDHQVENEPEVLIDADGDALANAAQLADGAALEVLKRRVHGAKEKRTREADANERLVEDAGFERGDIGGDVGEFRHDVIDCRDGTSDCNSGRRRGRGGRNGIPRPLPLPAAPTAKVLGRARRQDELMLRNMGRSGAAPLLAKIAARACEP